MPSCDGDYIYLSLSCPVLAIMDSTWYCLPMSLLTLYCVSMWLALFQLTINPAQILNCLFIHRPEHVHPRTNQSHCCLISLTRIYFPEPYVFIFHASICFHTRVHMDWEYTYFLLVSWIRKKISLTFSDKKNFDGKTNFLSKGWLLSWASYKLYLKESAT